MHDQVRTDRRGWLAALIRMPAKLAFDITNPDIELLGAAAIHRRKRSDHAVAAGCDHKPDAPHQEHRRGDQRQAEAIAKAAKQVSGSQLELSIAVSFRAVNSLC